MLTYLLAIAVSLGSFGLYMTAFFFPELHRKYDLVWSGVGLFYGLVLWVCAGRITGGLLLGQIASVALLGWLGWQTLQLRLAVTPIEQRTQMPPSANSPSEVVQVTVEQIRSNFQQSAHRSPLAARLNQAIDRFEEQWISVTSWIKALQSTLSDPTEPTVIEPTVTQPTVTKPTAAPASVPSRAASAPVTDRLETLETIDVAELADRLEQQTLESQDRSPQAEEPSNGQTGTDSSDASRTTDPLRNRPRRV